MLQIDAYAQELLQTEPQIDNFATSLPDVLLFHANARERRCNYAQLLQAQTALCRRGESVQQGAQLLRRLLQTDRNNTTAVDQLRMFAPQPG